MINISAGVIGANFDANVGSVVNISGGEVGGGFEASTGSEVNIRGGVIDAGFVANGSVNVFGRDFLVDGQSVGDISIGETLMITDRDVTLSGLLSDGSDFSFVLNSTVVEGEDFFGPNANLSLTFFLVLGDSNLDGEVGFQDIPAFIEIMVTGTFLDEADINRDGLVNAMDIPPFIQLLISLV